VCQRADPWGFIDRSGAGRDGSVHAALDPGETSCSFQRTYVWASLCGDAGTEKGCMLRAITTPGGNGQKWCGNLSRGQNGSLYKQSAPQDLSGAKSNLLRGGAGSEKRPGLKPQQLKPARPQSRLKKFSRNHNFFLGSDMDQHAIFWSVFGPNRWSQKQAKALLLVTWGARRVYRRERFVVTGSVVFRF